MNGVGAEVNGKARPQGIKRLHEDSLEDDHRFAKRFHLLNIGLYSSFIFEKLVELLLADYHRFREP